MTSFGPDSPSFRGLMSRWATGVSLITCAGDDGPVGCTVNALTSLSLDPPRLLVCLDLTARTLEHLRAAGRFCVNMLGAEQQELSRRFASRSSTQAEKFDGTLYRSDHGTILLEGCIATLVCDVVDELVHGDHAIIVGEFVHGDARDGDPLIFFRSEFGTLVA
ncbi:MAG: flavin reductase family protein [Actinomycetia bacterium]|nr:flavin reductase family protein [Actinomycetes bacterium]